MPQADVTTPFCVENAFPSVFVRLCCPRPGATGTERVVHPRLRWWSGTGYGARSIDSLDVGKTRCHWNCTSFGKKDVFSHCTRNRPADVFFWSIGRICRMCLNSIWLQRTSAGSTWRRLRRVLLRKALSWKSVMKDRQRLPNLHCGRL